MRRSIILGSAVAACAAIGLASCSGVPELTPVTIYGSSNVFTPSGYSQTKIDDTHYKVKAAGTEATPQSRIEKIARARAAEIGVQEKQKYFKVTGVEHSVACTSAQTTYKGGKVPSTARPTVVLDVVYANEPTDAEFAEAKTSFESLSNELANEVVPPEAKATAIQRTRASCGQG
jgi:hypothetical protein